MGVWGKALGCVQPHLRELRLSQNKTLTLDSKPACYNKNPYSDKGTTHLASKIKTAKKVQLMDT